MSLERWLFALHLRFRSIFRRSRVESELDDELLFHLEHLTQGNIAKGMSPQDARDHALKAMQGYEQKHARLRTKERTVP